MMKVQVEPLEFCPSENYLEGGVFDECVAQMVQNRLRPVHRSVRYFVLV